jgi:hypothetical protein
VTGAVVVGTGFGCVTHVESLRRAGFDVVALVGRDAKRTAERAAAAGVANPMTSLADALQSSVADAGPPVHLTRIVGTGGHRRDRDSAANGSRWVTVVKD